jgi:hypothetical protein
MRGAALLTVFLAGMALAPPAEALEARITEIRIAGGTMRAAIEVRDLFPERFRTILEQGGAIHLRLQLELWEDRPVWDKLAQPALVSIFRILLDPATREVSVADEFGEVSRQPAWSEPLQLRLDLGRADTLGDSAKYYVRVAATLGTIADRDPAGGAAIGTSDSTVSLGAMGRALFHGILEVSDYLQSVSSDWRSRVITGREFKAGVKPLG